MQFYSQYTKCYFNVLNWELKLKEKQILDFPTSIQHFNSFYFVRY